MSDKQSVLNEVLNEIAKKFGKGAIHKLGDSVSVAEKGSGLSTGSIGLDMALGIGGYPRGRIIEVYGPESSGKTTLALHAIAESQKEGGSCVFIDVEHALDSSYAQKLGVNINELFISQPSSGEEALQIANEMIKTGAISVVVVDSVAALVPKAEIEGNVGDSHVGLQARLMSQALRKLTGDAQRSGCIVIFINQIRQKIGVIFGNPETTTGGNSLKYSASVRLEVRKIGVIKDKDEIVGNDVRVKVVKNKVAPPFKNVEFEIIYGEGISRIGEVIEIAAKKGIIEKSGAWYSYNGEKLGQGKDKAKQFLKENEKILKEVEDKIISSIS